MVCVAVVILMRLRLFPGRPCGGARTPGVRFAPSAVASALFTIHCTSRYSSSARMRRCRAITDGGRTRLTPLAPVSVAIREFDRRALNAAARAAAPAPAPVPERPRPSTGASARAGVPVRAAAAGPPPDAAPSGPESGENRLRHPGAWDLAASERGIHSGGCCKKRVKTKQIDSLRRRRARPLL